MMLGRVFVVLWVLVGLWCLGWAAAALFSAIAGGANAADLLPLTAILVLPPIFAVGAVQFIVLGSPRPMLRSTKPLNSTANC